MNNYFQCCYDICREKIQSYWHKNDDISLIRNKSNDFDKL